MSEILPQMHMSVWNFDTFVTWQRDWKVQELTAGFILIGHKTNKKCYHSTMNSEIVSGKSCRMKALVWICTPTGILRYRETDLDVFYKRLKSSGMLCRVDCYVVTDVSAKRGSSIFKIKQSRKINHFSSLETWIFNAALRTWNHEFHFVSHHYTSYLA